MFATWACRFVGFGFGFGFAGMIGVNFEVRTSRSATLVLQTLVQLARVIAPAAAPLFGVEAQYGVIGPNFSFRAYATLQLIHEGLTHIICNQNVKLGIQVHIEQPPPPQACCTLL
jgi:hypothetical protein